MQERKRSTENNSPSFNTGEHFARSESLVFGSFGGSASGEYRGAVQKSSSV